jgi:hypothetical protein
MKLAFLLWFLAVNLSATISIKFQGSGTAMASTEVAGVTPVARWNNAAGAVSARALNLVDDKGSATGAAITWSADNLWTIPITDTAGNNRLMRGYLDDGAGKPTTVTVVNLQAGSYTVYVYADGDNAASTKIGTYTLTSGITVTSQTITDPANTNFSGAFTPGANYAAFPLTLTAAGGFTLTATPGISTDTVPRAPVNGIQIVPAAPPPAPVPTLTVPAPPGIAVLPAGTLQPGACNTYPYPAPGVKVLTDIIVPNTLGSLSTLTGYSGPTAVTVHPYPQDNTVVFEVCNKGLTVAAFSAVTVGYKVIR